MYMEYTIEITQYCPNECDYCSSDATPDGKHLPLKVILEFLDGNNIGPDDRVNISGGEPLAHPDIYRILTECQKRTSNVWVYTNAIRQIKYNPHVVTDGIKIEANLCLAEGCFALPFTIPKGVRVNFLKFIPVGRGQGVKPLDYHMSGNIIENCGTCKHLLLQADGRTVKAPCKKCYGRDNLCVD